MNRRCFLGAAAGMAWRAGADDARPLFNGANLAGWNVVDGPESAFYVQEGAIIGSPSSEYPAWLRSDRQYENFEFEMEYFLQGWMDGGLYFSAPEHGHKGRSGFKVSLFHQADEKPRTNSAGAIFPYIAPRLVNVKSKGQWNALKVRLDWPSLQVWSNGELTHDLDVDKTLELRRHLRSGYLGLETLSYPLRFRNLRIRELASKQKWDVLYESPADLDKWTITESNERAPAKFTGLGRVLRSDGLGNLTTKAKYRDFEFQAYIRGVEHHNGGVLFRSAGGRDRYEIQLHDVAEAHYPTGSLYFFERAKYPDLRPEEWFLFQLFVKDRTCAVRINGEDVLEYDGLERLDPGFIELQAHQTGRWMEYKQVRIRQI